MIFQPIPVRMDWESLSSQMNEASYADFFCMGANRLNWFRPNIIGDVPFTQLQSGVLIQISWHLIFRPAVRFPLFLRLRAHQVDALTHSPGCGAYRLVLLRSPGSRLHALADADPPWRQPRGKTIFFGQLPYECHLEGVASLGD